MTAGETLLRGSPAHQRIFPSLPGVKGQLPLACVVDPGLHGCACGHRYEDSAALHVLVGHSRQRHDVLRGNGTKAVISVRSLKEELKREIAALNMTATTDRTCVNMRHVGQLPQAGPTSGLNIHYVLCTSNQGSYGCIAFRFTHIQYFIILLNSCNPLMTE